MINRAPKNQQPPRQPVQPVFAPSSTAPYSDNTGQDPVALGMLHSSLGADGTLVILRSFIAFACEVIAELQDAVRARRTAEAHVALTELSNSCSVIGASSLVKSCMLLEEELLKPDWVRVEHCMSALIRESRVVGGFINELLSPATDEPFSS